MTSEPGRWRHWWAVHLRWWWNDVVLLFTRTLTEFVEDHCAQLAASISYYVLFSIFPLASLLMSIAGVVLRDPGLHARAVDTLLATLPLSKVSGRAAVESVLHGVSSRTSGFGVVGALGLLWSASGIMSAVRYALDEAWDTKYTRPFLQGKLVDVLMLLGAGALLTVSVAGTMFLQVARRVSERLSARLGPLGAGATLGVEVVAVALPVLITFATYMLLYKVAPSVRTRFRHVWPGALLATVLFELVKNGFAVYLRYFGDYDRVYGSLGVVIAFLVFVYLSATILLLGAEMAAEWPRITHGHYDEAEAARASSETSLRERALSALASLVLSERRPRDEVDPDARRAREQRRAEEVEQRVRASRPGSAPPGEVAAVPPGAGDEGASPERDER
jgi:membrane protein